MLDEAAQAAQGLLASLDQEPQPWIDRPRTQDKLDALPEGPAFDFEDRIINGRMVRVPIAPRVAVVPWGSDDDIVSWIGSDGEAYSLSIYADGRW